MATASCQIPGGFFTEEFYDGRNALLGGGGGRVRRRLDPQDGDSFRDEILQQVAVVAGDFDDVVLRTRVGVAP